MIDAAVLDGKKFEKIGEGGDLVDLEEFQISFDLVPDFQVPVVFPDVKLAFQEVDHRMIGHPPAVGEALAFEEGHLLVGDGLSKLVEQPALTHPGVGHNGHRLSPAVLGPGVNVKEKFKLALTTHKWGQALLGVHIEAGPAAARGDDPVDLEGFGLSFDFLLAQIPQSERTLR